MKKYTITCSTIDGKEKFKTIVCAHDDQEALKTCLDKLVRGWNYKKDKWILSIKEFKDI